MSGGEPMFTVILRCERSEPRRMRPRRQGRRPSRRAVGAHLRVTGDKIETKNTAAPSAGFPPARRSAVRRRRGPRRFPDRPRYRAWRRCGSCSSWRFCRGCSHRDELFLDAEFFAEPGLHRRLRGEHHATTRCGRGRRRRTSGGNAPAAASGSRRWDRPSARRRSSRP